MWYPIETVPSDRDVWVSDGTMVAEARMNGLGMLVWTGDDDTLFPGVTHWQEWSETSPEPSDGNGPTAAEIYRALRAGRGAEVDCGASDISGHVVLARRGSANR